MSGKRMAVALCLPGLGLCAWAQWPVREPVVAEPPVRIGLALSGGAALGLAHIGVLKVLERESIPVVAISGTSMGSLIGGLYAAGYSAHEIESLALSVDWVRLFSSSLPFGAQYLPERQQAQRYVLQLRNKNLIPFLPSGLLPMQNIELLLMRLLADIEYNTGYDFDSLPIPFRAVAVGLDSGEPRIIGRGRLEQAIRASIAGPGVFAPERLEGRELVDGGVLRSLPVDALDSIAPTFDLRIGVLTAKRNAETGLSLIDIASRSTELTGSAELKRQEQLADVLIRPNVDPFTHSAYERAAGLIAAGESAAEASLPRIRELIRGRRAARPVRPVVERQLPIVRSIRFEGLRVTRERTARKEVMTRPGAPLQFSRLIDDLERLFNTGLFEDVNYRLDALGGDSADVIIEVQERAYGFYSVGIRYDNADNLVFGFEVGQGNLGGSGASVRAAFDLGKPNEARLGLTGTTLFQLPVGYRLDGFLGSVDRSYYELSQSLGDYRVSYRGGVAEAGYILGRDAFFDFGLNGYWAAYRVPDELPRSESLHADQPEWIAGPTFRLEVNTFRDVNFPTAGVVSKIEVLSSITAMKATRQFVKFVCSDERILPVSSRLLFRPALDLGLSLPRGQLALAEQFRTGGAGFVGFASDHFTSPQRAVVRVGMDFKFFRLFGQEDYPFYLQAVGNVGCFSPWGDLLTISDLPSLLHWGAGAGARTNTPIGPVQLIVGVGDFGGTRPEHRSALAFFFSIGREFRYTR